MLALIMFFLINVMHIAKEWQSAEIVTLALLCDSVLFSVIMIITWFYFFEIHRKIATFCKKIPFIKGIAEFLRKILKEVQLLWQKRKYVVPLTLNMIMNYLKLGIRIKILNSLLVIVHRSKRSSYAQSQGKVFLYADMISLHH